MSGVFVEEPLVFVDDSSTGWPRLNLTRLKQVVEDEGFHFVECSGLLPGARESIDSQLKMQMTVDSSETRTLVLFLTAEHLRVCNFSGYMPLGGLLQDVGECSILPILEDTTKRLILKWLSKETECIVCFEESVFRGRDFVRAKDHLICCKCSAHVCFGCHLDLMRLTEAGTSQCPNCRVANDVFTNVAHVFDVLRATPSLAGLSTAQRAAVSHWTGFDGSQSVGYLKSKSDRWSKMATAVYFTEAMDEAMPGESCFSDKILEMCKFTRKSESAKSHTAAAIRSGAMARKPGDACANCGKAFWDRKERRRAPKCPKCKRTVYCTAKCRKLHRKKHTSECSATQKKKAKASKKKKKSTQCCPF